MDADNRNDDRWTDDLIRAERYEAGRRQYEHDLGGIAGAPDWSDLDHHWQILFERKATRERTDSEIAAALGIETGDNDE